MTGHLGGECVQMGGGLWRQWDGSKSRAWREWDDGAEQRERGKRVRVMSE